MLLGFSVNAQTLISKTKYYSIGTDQVITVPDGANYMKVKAWGAGGSHEVIDIGGKVTSGTGGYTYAEFGENIVKPGTQFTIVVGRGGMQTQARPGGDRSTPINYGFGGAGVHDQGGGLSGVFLGADNVLDTDQNRALIIAGGGAGSDDGYGPAVGGTNGNSPNSGGHVGSMQGLSDDVCGNGEGRVTYSASGGGYEGGNRTSYQVYNVYSSCKGEGKESGMGGSGYISPKALKREILWSEERATLPPKTDDIDYENNIGKAGETSWSQSVYQGGNGLVVIEFYDYIPPTPSYCHKPANTSGVGLDTNHGITLLKRAGNDGDGNKNNDWPMVRKGAWTALESNSKGLVFTRMTTAQINAISNPQEGMISYDTDEKCLKIYNGTKWSCFSTPSCPQD